MTQEVRTVLLLLHLASMLFMAAPLYMLIIVNERARFPVPAGYNTDRYMENIIARQPLRCYAYMAVILATGVLLVGGRGWTWADPSLVIKLVVFAVLVVLLTYVQRGIQPKVEAVLAPYKAGEQVSEQDRKTLVRWRMRRKRLAATCLFLVLTSLVMGLRVTMSYSAWLAAAFVIAAALFAWRAYKAPVRLGWF